MMADQPPPLEATPLLNEVPILPHMVNGDSIQQASKSLQLGQFTVGAGIATFKSGVENRTDKKTGCCTTCVVAERQ